MKAGRDQVPCLPARPRRPPAALKAALDALYEEYNREGAQDIERALGGDRPAVPDPVQLVHRYEDSADREIAGFCAAGLAFGRVESILRSVDRLLEVMRPSPAAFVRAFDPATDQRKLESLGHRWTRAEDLAALLLVLRRMLDHAGSIESFFVEGDDPCAPDVGPAIESFCRRALDTSLSTVYGRAPARPGVAYFFPRPSLGSACKRLNLYLRWMVRRDGIDPGGWTRVKPSRLIVPLDVHVVRVGRCLGLTRRTSPGWEMAREVTGALRQFDPDDPVRYDFALCHVGMRDQCGFGRPVRDGRCPLRGFCRPAGRRPRRSRRPSGPR